MCGEMIGEGKSAYGFFVAVPVISDGEVEGIVACCGVKIILGDWFSSELIKDGLAISISPGWLFVLKLSWLGGEERLREGGKVGKDES